MKNAHLIAFIIVANETGWKRNWFPSKLAIECLQKAFPCKAKKTIQSYWTAIRKHAVETKQMEVAGHNVKWTGQLS